MKSSLLMMFLLFTLMPTSFGGDYCASNMGEEITSTTLDTLSSSIPVDERYQALKKDYETSGMCDPIYNYTGDSKLGVYFKAIGKEAYSLCPFQENNIERSKHLGKLIKLQEDLGLALSDKVETSHMLEECQKSWSEREQLALEVRLLQLFKAKYKESEKSPPLPGTRYVHEMMAKIAMLKLKADGSPDCDDQFIEPDAFKKAMEGFENLKKLHKVQKTQFLTIVDYTKPSNTRRMYVIDLNNNRVVNQTWVAHGMGTVGNLAAKGVDGFGSAPQTSNTPNSNLSSGGFIRTMENYKGEYGPSMRLEGLDQTNSNIRARAIVLHPFGVQNLLTSDPEKYRQGLQSLDAVDLNDRSSLIQTLNHTTDQSLSPYINATQGCLGISNEPAPIRGADGSIQSVTSESEFLRNTLSGGSIIFSYTGADQTSKYFK
jgi:hypothetical protein